MNNGFGHSISKNLSAGGTISGDLTIDGDLTVSGGGTLTYDETVTGDLFIDKNFTGTTTATTKGLYVDFDATGITASGQTATNIGLDLDMNSDSPTMVGTVNNTGLDLDVVGGTSGTTKNIGIDVSVSGADTNYAALFNGGYVGIGTTAPAMPLHIVNSSGGRVMLHNTTGGSSSLLGSIMFGANDGDTNLAMIGSYQDGATDSASIRFETEATGGSITERMRITSTGNVGIGETNPDTRLHVNEQIDVAYSVANFITDSNALLKLENPSGTDTAFATIQFRTGSSNSQQSI